MSDLVERLRELSAYGDPTIYNEAAAEIARLQGDYSHLEECNRMNMAEIERLREQQMRSVSLNFCFTRSEMKPDIPKTAMAPKEFEPYFATDKFGWVTAHLPDGGKLQSQSVEAHLLFAILQHLENRR